jgi:hypothetical protein
MEFSGNNIYRIAFFKIVNILMKVIHIFFYIIILSITSGYGQSQIPQVINTSGGSSQNRGYSIEWSIGELALVNQMNSTDGSNILTNGFIQPLSENIIPYNQTEFSSANVHIFPNPTHDILEIDFFQNIDGKISVQLSNELGHIMYKREIVIHGLGFVEKVNMKRFTNGIYMLYIKRLNPVSGRYDLETSSYKIIKL